MTTTLDVGRRHRSLAELTFSRTVDRSLLHRRALAEVFLTDATSVDDGDYLAAAQLPPFHAYYTDHIGGRIDPLLLLECARQAETYGGHAYLGVPLGTNFILRRWSMTIHEPALLRKAVAPAEIGLAVRTHHARYVHGSLRSLSYEIDLVLDQASVGTVEIHVSYLPSAVYQTLRGRNRTGQPPSSEDLDRRRIPLPRPAAAPVAPELVGRTNPRNVVLYEPLFGADSVSAVLRVPLDNPSMFDHPQDHLPGMVLMESARQLGLLILRADYGLTPADATLVDLSTSFSQYADLDDATVVRAHRHPAGHVSDFSRGGVGRVSMIITFEQRDVVVADATICFAIAEDAASRRWGAPV